MFVGARLSGSLKEDDIDQVIGHAVVASFVHHKRHPQQNPLIPSVGISSEGGVIAALYDCQSDVLLSRPPEVTWLNRQDRTLDRCGVVLLWLLLHHSLFLKRLSGVNLKRAELLRNFANGGALEHYLNLASHHVASWPGKRSTLTVQCKLYGELRKVDCN